jgi:predicted metalloprotease
MTSVPTTSDQRRRRTTCTAVVAVLIAVGLLVTGCTRAIEGKAAPLPSEFDGRSPGPVAQVAGGTLSRTDVLAANVVAGVEGYWRRRFPEAFNRQWVNIHGFFAIDPKKGKPPPCMKQAADMTDQATYCPAMDSLAWDRVGLLPRLVREYGPPAVVFALSHEIGHAVQNRLGIDASTQLTLADRYPTILLEGMADCYAGSVMNAVVAGTVPKVSMSPRDLDRALQALVSFRDPISGIGTAPVRPHGDAFDRISAFIDGYSGGPVNCSGMTVQNQVFTARGYSSIYDQAIGGNLELPDLLSLLGPDVSGWLGPQVTAKGGRWSPPRLAVGGSSACSLAGVAREGGARFCPAGNVIAVSSSALGDVHDRLGDYASGAIVVSRYALAALAALGRPVRGPAASASVLCLTGAYTRMVFDRAGGFTLSPGDIDEAVHELLEQNFVAQDVVGAAPPEDLGFARISQFRTGVLGGPTKCGL